MIGPKRIDRYLLSEILGPFITSLLFLYVLLLTLQIMRGIDVLFGAGVRPMDIVAIALYQGPHFLVMAMPISTLFAVMLAIGRLSDDRETLAFIASGVSPARLLVAPTAFGLVVGLVGVWLAHGPDPRGLAAVQVRVNEIIKDNMATEVKPGIFYSSLGNMTIYAQEVSSSGHRFKNLMISDERDPQASVFMLAREGRFDTASGGDILKLDLGMGEMHRAQLQGEDYAVVDFESGVISVDVGGPMRKQNRFGRSREELTPDELIEAAARARADGKIKAAIAFDIARAKRTTAPLAAVVFAMCAVPLAMGRRGGARAIGAIATIGAYVGYYVIGRVGEAQVGLGIMPAWVAMHLANALFLLAAIVLIRRASRAER